MKLKNFHLFTFLSLCTLTCNVLAEKIGIENNPTHLHVTDSFYDEDLSDHPRRGFLRKPVVYLKQETTKKTKSKSKKSPKIPAKSTASLMIGDDPQFGPSSPVSDQAMNLLGIPYKWGGMHLKNGMDCSGFMVRLYQLAFGVTLPRTSHNMAMELPVAPSHLLRPGDLVFFNTRGSKYSHVGIYLGGRLFAHAPRTGSTTRIDSFLDHYWKTHFTGARRPLNDTQMAQIKKYEPDPRLFDAQEEEFLADNQTAPTFKGDLFSVHGAPAAGESLDHESSILQSRGSPLPEIERCEPVKSKKKRSKSSH